MVKMKPVRQQRAGRGYLSAVLRDAIRPYDFRGGLRRLLNAGDAASMRAAHTYGSLPFNLKYLQHAAQGDGGLWPGVFTTAPVSVSMNPGNRSTMPERGPAPVDFGRPGANTKFDSGMGVQGTEAKESHAPAGRLSSVPPAEPQEPAWQPEKSISIERLRQGPPPLVTSRPVTGQPDNVRPVLTSPENDVAGGAAGNPASKRGPDETVTRNRESGREDKTAHSHVLSRLARQLEEYNFGGRQRDAGSREPRGETAGQVSGFRQSRSAPPPMDSGFSNQDRSRSPGQHAADIAGPASGRIMPSATQSNRTESTTVVPDSAEHAGHTPMQEQLRLMRSLEKATVARPGGKAEREMPVREPVNASKKQQSPPVKKSQPVVRRTIVRRAAAPAFWERSYLSHAGLRIYK